MNSKEQHRYLTLDLFARRPLSVQDVVRYPVFGDILSHQHDDHCESSQQQFSTLTYQHGLLSTSASVPVAYHNKMQYRLSLFGHQQWQRLQRNYTTDYAHALREAHDMAASRDWYDSATQILSPILFGIFAFRKCGQSIEDTFMQFDCSVFTVCDRYRIATQLIQHQPPGFRSCPVFRNLTPIRALPQPLKREPIRRPIPTPASNPLTHTGQKTLLPTAAA